MLRTLTFLAAISSLAGAFVLYSVTFETRRIEQSVQAQERAADKARSDIAILKAERAHLARPERIGELARGLGLGPVKERQIVKSERAEPGRSTP